MLPFGVLVEITRRISETRDFLHMMMTCKHLYAIRVYVANSAARLVGAANVEYHVICDKRKHGVQVTKYRDYRMTHTENYVFGSVDGLQFTCDHNGALTYMENYSMNRKHGICMKYRDDLRGIVKCQLHTHDVRDRRNVTYFIGVDSHTLLVRSYDKRKGALLHISPEWNYIQDNPQR
jgi:hypothetical protein